jgi:hypothetical protein
MTSLIASLMLTACDTTTLPGTSGGPGNRRGIDSMPGRQPVGPGQFGWEGTPLRRSGESTAPSPGLPTSDLLARAEARRSALRALEIAVRELPVNNTATVGQAVDRSVSLSLSVNRLLQKAKTVDGSMIRQPDGRIALTVELPTSDLADSLRQHKVTPERGLPQQPSMPDTGVPGAPVV